MNTLDSRYTEFVERWTRCIEQHKALQQRWNEIQLKPKEKEETKNS